MAKFIEVTQFEGERLLVNPQFIVAVSNRIKYSKGGATIDLEGENNTLIVKETYEEIKAKLEVVND